MQLLFYCSLYRVLQKNVLAWNLEEHGYKCVFVTPNMLIFACSQVSFVITKLFTLTAHLIIIGPTKLLKFYCIIMPTFFFVFIIGL